MLIIIILRIRRHHRPKRTNSIDLVDHSLCNILFSLTNEQEEEEKKMSSSLTQVFSNQLHVQQTFPMNERVKRIRHVTSDC